MQLLFQGRDLLRADQPSIAKRLLTGKSNGHAFLGYVYKQESIIECTATESGLVDARQQSRLDDHPSSANQGHIGEIISGAGPRLQSITQSGTLC